MFKVALSLLGSLQPKLLQLDDFESIVMLMREWKREGECILTLCVLVSALAHPYVWRNIIESIYCITFRIVNLYRKLTFMWC